MMNNDSVTLPEVINALKALGGKGRSRDIENYVINARGGILPKAYKYGGWESYHRTINQVIQFHCSHYEKFR
jgi:hypothetical protein